MACCHGSAFGGTLGRGGGGGGGESRGRERHDMRDMQGWDMDRGFMRLGGAGVSQEITMQSEGTDCASQITNEKGTPCPCLLTGRL